MCSNGVNTNQLKSTIKQIDDEVALMRRWTHQLYHLADGGQMPKTAAKLQEIQGAFDDIRALLTDAGDLADEDDEALVDVKLV
ncbi:MAG: hypothetical protein SOV74_07715 [Coriobacteriales bacterium]|jgi:hypothetical protein|nr:hypothetical protein [Coriobacteriales bacterium]